MRIVVWLLIRLHGLNPTLARLVQKILMATAVPNRENSPGQRVGGATGCSSGTCGLTGNHPDGLQHSPNVLVTIIAHPNGCSDMNPLAATATLNRETRSATALSLAFSRLSIHNTDYDRGHYASLRAASKASPMALQPTWVVPSDQMSPVRYPRSRAESTACSIFFAAMG